MTDNNGGYGQYPSSEHPEDQPNFGQQPVGNPYSGAAPGAAFTGGDFYGDYAAQQPQANINHLYNAPMVVRERGLNIGQCLTYGFKATFARPLLWILGAFIYCVISFFSGFFGAATTEINGGGSSIVAQLPNMFVSLVIFVLSPHIYYALIKQVDGEKLTLNQVMAGVKWLPGIATMILTGIICVVPVFILSAIFVLPTIKRMANATYVSQDEIVGLAIGMVGAICLITFVSLFFMILFQTAVYYAVEGRTGVIGAIKTGVRDVARNYLLFLVLSFIVSIALMIGFVITFGLGLVILLPVAAHTMVYAYRQMSQAPYPNI